MFGIKPEVLDLALSITMIDIQSIALFLVMVSMMFIIWKGDERQTLFSNGSLKWAIGVSLFLGSLLSYLFYREWGPSYTLLSIEFGVGITLGLLHPSMALCFFIANQFLRPWEIMEANEFILAMPRVLFLLVLGSWTFHSLMTSKFRITWNSSCTLVAAFAAWLYLTTFVSPDSVRSQVIYFDGITRNIALYFLILNVIRTKTDLKAMGYSMLYAVCGVTACAVYYTLTQEAPVEEAGRLRSVSMMGNSNDLAAIMIMVLPYILVWVSSTSKLWRWIERLIRASLLIFAFIIIWWTKSRGALIGTGVVGAGFLLQQMKTKRQKWIALVAMGVGLVLAGTLFNRSEEDSAMSTSSRKLYWKTAVYMGVKNPVLGVGYAAYPLCFEQYSPETALEWGHRTAHSSWLLVLGETGFVGFTLYMVLFWGALRIAWRLRFVQCEIFLMFLGYITAMTFLSHSYLIYPYCVLGFVLASEKVHRNESLANTSSSLA